jgi:DNA replication protein DnaC
MDNYDIFNALSPEMQERMRESQEHIRRIMEKRDEYCAILGIDPHKHESTPSYLEMRACDLEAAAKIKPFCDSCTWDVTTCKDCEHILKLYDDYSHKNPFLRCDKFEKYKQMMAVKARTERLLGKSGLGKRFAQRKFETFKPTPETQGAFDACVAFCDNFTEDSKGLRLVGSYGCGKTHLTASIIHRLAEQGIGGVFVVVPELLRAIRRGYNQQNDDSDRLVKLTEEAPLLVLDDLGAEKPSDWVREQLYVIINRRYENMLPTIVTTNCTTQELVERVGQRTVSRLIEMTTPIKITAKDYRMRI